MAGGKVLAYKYQHESVFQSLTYSCYSVLNETKTRMISSAFFSIFFVSTFGLGPMIQNHYNVAREEREMNGLGEQVITMER